MSADDIAAVISTFVGEVNGGEIASALARFTADVTIVEDLAPYRWQGPEAGGHWLAAMAANAERMGVSSVIMDLGPAERIEVEGPAAYAIFAGTVVFDRPEGPLYESGRLTFALVDQGGAWRIAALTWTGEAPSAR